MDDCCNGKSEHLESLRNRQARVLSIVLAINSTMFAAEVTAGLLAGSMSLLADSLDMLGDALVYGASLYVIGRSLKARASAATLSRNRPPNRKPGAT